MEATKTKQETITIIVTRQNDPSSAPYEETFHVPYRENMNVISALMENPGETR